MNTTITDKNAFLKKIASHLGYKSINNKDFISDCETILGHGGASNFFVYCSDNREFLKKTKKLVQSTLLDFFDSLGESPRTYTYTLFGKPIDEEEIAQILSFLYGLKIPDQGTACDWLVWASVETEIFNREEEIENGKWN